QRSPIDFARPKPKGEAYNRGSKMFDRMKPAGKFTQIITYRMIQIEIGRTKRAAVAPRPFNRYNIAKLMTAAASRARLRTWRTESCRSSIRADRSGRSAYARPSTTPPRPFRLTGNRCSSRLSTGLEVKSSLGARSSRDAKVEVNALLLINRLLIG